MTNGQKIAQADIDREIRLRERADANAEEWLKKNKDIERTLSIREGELFRIEQGDSVRICRQAFSHFREIRREGENVSIVFHKDNFDDLYNILK